MSDVLTPNCLLYGRNLDRENKIAEEIDFGVIEGRFAGKKSYVTKCCRTFLVGMVS